VAIVLAHSNKFDPLRITFFRDQYSRRSSKGFNMNMSTLAKSRARMFRKAVATKALFLLAALVMVLPMRGGAAVAVLTYHNDNARTGANTNETILTPAKVNTNTFGLIFSRPVDDWVYAQPLLMTNVVVPGKGTHNIVYVCTVNDSIYAFDADDPTVTLPYWQTNYLNANSVPPRNSDMTGACGGNYQDFHGYMGIVGTPVIDPVAGTMYVVVRTKEFGTNYVQRLRALDITTGADRPNSPVIISATYAGTGDGSVGGVLTFDPFKEDQRPGLVLANGMVYIGFSSHCDWGPYHGWLISYNATTLARTSVFNTSPNGGLAGIWSAGGAPALDAAGNIFFNTGNGTFNAASSNYADSFIRLSTTNGLALVDYFTPFNQAALSSADQDVASGGIIALPDSVGSVTHPHLMAGASKAGTLYLIDRDSMGHFNAANDSQIVQSIPNAIGQSYDTPAYFNGSLYLSGTGDPLKAYSISAGVLSTTPTSVSTDTYGFNAPTVSISANGTANGIAWALQVNGWGTGLPAILRAYDASNLANELYTSSQRPRDNAPGAVKFTLPVVANGKVYVGGQYGLAVYGTSTGTNAYLASFKSAINGFSFVLSDSGSAVVANILQVILDSTSDVTASVTHSYAAPLTSCAYTQATRFPSGSLHTVSITWVDSFNATNSWSTGFVIPAYSVMPTNLALPFAALDTTRPGFAVASYQSFQNNPNAVRWTDELVMGYHGGNAASQTGASGGFFSWPGAVDFSNISGKNPTPGFFPNNYDLFSFGIGANYPQDNLHDFYDNSAMEMFGYIYYPTSGLYNMVIGSDDGFQFSIAQNPLDRMGTPLFSLNGARLPTSGSLPTSADIHSIVIDQPGAYPFRLLWENGVGSAGLEWYTVPPVGTTPLPAINSFLINDTNNAGTSGGVVLLTYQALVGGTNAGPYVKKAQPVRDSMSAVYYQPVVVDLGDGSGTRAVNTASVALSVDGTSQTISAVKSSGVTHVLQTTTPNWATGPHTILLTFADTAGTNYTYTWPFTVIGGANGAPFADATNTPVPIPLSQRVDPATLSQPGLRIHSHQMEFKQANTIGTVEEQLMGLHGPNIADQSGTNGPGFFSWTNVVDVRLASGLVTYPSANSGGEWSYDYSPSVFGIKPQVLNNLANGVPNNADNCALEIAAYIVFPTNGTYIMFFNSDDGFRVISPFGRQLFGKAGIEIGGADVGRGMVGTTTGVRSEPASRGFLPFSIPQAGAYPIRAVWENGGGDAGVEWSIYQYLPDGSVARVAINDSSTPGSLQTFQVSSAATGPTVSYQNPAPFSHDAVYFQPLVIKISDGTGATTDPSRIDGMTMDGQTLAFNTPTKSGGVTTIVAPPLFGAWAPNLNHTNVLRYHDSLGANYTNIWSWRVQNFSPFGVVQIPASYGVSPASLSQPGFRIRSYQTTGSGQPNAMNWTEEQLLGLHGANIADQSHTNGPGFFVWTNLVDFTITPTGGANSGGGEWNYDFAFTNPAVTPFGFVKNPSTATDQSQNSQTLDVASWLVFNQAGDYIMTVNSDDGFRATVPYGNPQSRTAGAVYLNAFEGGRGTAGAGFDPRGGVNWFAFHIPTAAAYPFRMLWENGGGGGGVEWSIWQSLPDGSVAYLPVNDPNTAGSIRAYQVSTNDTPFIANITPFPAELYGSGPSIFLTPGLPTPTPLVAGATNDLTILLQDAATTVNTNTLTLSLNGAVQPITITASNGLTTITRYATNQPYWPPGAWGQLMLTFNDNTGRTINMPVAYVSTAFWGTLANQNPYPLGSGDNTKRGFLARIYQVDGLGTTSKPDRNHVAEQALAGLWSNNVSASISSAFGSANNFLPPPAGGYFILAGTGPTNGLINFNPAGGSIGDFTSANGYPDQLLPGIPGLGSVANRTNSFAAEFLSFVEFPTNGTYLLGVSSDDGFRLTKGWGAANNNGALVVNSPATLQGPKPTAQSTFPLTLTVGNGTSLPITNAITGNLVLAQGPFSGGTPNNPYGSTNYNGLGYSVDGCVINNSLAGGIALMYRSTSCSYVQQVANAAAAGAIAVVFVQNRPATEGWFPTEPNPNPPVQPIPAVMIQLNDGLKLIAAMATNTVNVTLTPMDYLVNPTVANSPLGQADYGKGAGDVLFPLIVPTAGVYPLRLVYEQGGGGANIEFFSVYGTNRVLINDANSTNGTALRAFYGLTAKPTIGFTFNGVSFSSTNQGTLQTNAIIPITSSNWVDIYNNAPLTIPVIPNGPQKYYRSR
jgi:hypothetical protein